MSRKRNRPRKHERENTYSPDLAGKRQGQPAPEDLGPNREVPGIVESHIHAHDLIEILRCRKADGSYIFSEVEVQSLLRAAMPLAADAVQKKQANQYRAAMNVLFDAVKIHQQQQALASGQTAAAQANVVFYLPENNRSRATLQNYIKGNGRNGKNGKNGRDGDDQHEDD